jgi:transcriptional regulator with PAS, ATPase and Fis domain
MERITGIDNNNTVNKPVDLLSFYESKNSQEKLNIFDCIKNNSRNEEKVSRSLYLETVRKNRIFVFVQISKNMLPDYPGNMIFITDLSKEYFCSYIEKEERNTDSFYGIVGNHKKMRELYDLIKIASESLANVLITGESGTGKELVAKAVHINSDRKDRPFVIVNCSALTETLLESELFGHVKGSFTGAYKDKEGKFEAAHGGTLFLDEIGDISPAVQLKLLRVI